MILYFFVIKIHHIINIYIIKSIYKDIYIYLLYIKNCIHKMKYYSDNDGTCSDDDDETNDKLELDEEISISEEMNDIIVLYNIIQEFREKENPFILDKLKLINLYKFLDINTPILKSSLNMDINCNKN